MGICFEPIGTVRTTGGDPPRHWSVSDLEGVLDIRPEYREGLSDLKAGDRIAVVFHFHRSGPFTPDLLRQRKRHREETAGVFSLCSPRRPNPVGLSILDVLEVSGCRIRVRGLDMSDGTPILDVKPWSGPDGPPRAGG
jgi:tRNA-Thr(GGU) m(6)t(6)A37 methyltransferase TsaA